MVLLSAFGYAGWNDVMPWPKLVNLSDVTLLLTRPAPDAERFRRQCEARIGQFGQVVVSPLLDVVFLGAAPEDRGETLLFTSANGVRAFMEGGGKPNRFAYVVGARTGAEAREFGFDVEEIGPTVDDMVRRLAQLRPASDLLHITGRHQRGALTERLQDVGISARKVVLYDQKAQPLNLAAKAAFRDQGLVVAPIFSPRTAELLRSELPGDAQTPKAVALSQAVADAWGQPAEIAKSPDADAMINAIFALLETQGASG